MQVLEPGQEFLFVVKAHLGTLQPTFHLNVSYTSATPPSRARLALRGKGPDSHLGASSYLVLEQRGHDATDLTWSLDLAASGLVANVGERLIEAAAHKLAAEFLDAVKERVEAPAVPPPSEDTSDAQPPNHRR